MSKNSASEYIVKLGDTLDSIAERVYGDCRFATFIANSDPLARADCLFVGHRLALPPEVASAESQSVMSQQKKTRAARPLGHARIRLHFLGREEVLRYYSPPHRGVGGWIGDMTICRSGSLNLAQLSPPRIWGYYGEHLAWIGDVLSRYARGFPLQPDCVLKGRLQEWFIGTSQCERASAVVDHQMIRNMSSLVLDEAEDELNHNHVPFGHVLVAACPDHISPGFLRQLAPNALIRLKATKIGSGANTDPDPSTGQRARTARRKKTRSNAKRKSLESSLSKSKTPKTKKVSKQTETSKRRSGRSTVNE